MRGKPTPRESSIWKCLSLRRKNSQTVFPQPISTQTLAALHVLSWRIPVDEPWGYEAAVEGKGVVYEEQLKGFFEEHYARRADPIYHCLTLDDSDQIKALRLFKGRTKMNPLRPQRCHRREQAPNFP
ncbi:hypothetical protein K438DRAFT_2023853 [Mycena galopus ATCC 62051]|nr:hypothetical protein K438DRAFT_2023853 [Mycena galopus ATCC 62051]